MTWKRNVLVVANVTATSNELMSALRARAERETTAFTLVVPATTFGGGRAAAERSLEEAIVMLRDAGLEVVGSVEAADPVVAVTDVWDPKQYDEIIISTLPMRFSKWMHAGLPDRVERLTGAPVTHVISQPPKPQPQTVPAPVPERRPMGALSVLAWGGQRQR